MAAKKSKKTATEVGLDVTLADLNDLHTKTHNLFMDATDPSEQEELRLLMRMLSRRLRDLNEDIIKKNTAAYRGLAEAFAAAKKAAEEALTDVEKLADFIDDLANVVSKLGKVAAAVT